MSTKLHGESALTKITELPKNVRKIKPTSKTFVVADSETLGNQHVIDIQDDMEFFEGNNDTRFISAKSPFTVRCLLAETKHSNMVFDPGLYDINIAQEYDHVAQCQRKVRD